MSLITPAFSPLAFGATRHGTHLVGTRKDDFISIGDHNLSFLEVVEGLGGDDDIFLYDYRGRPLEFFGGQGFDSLSITRLPHESLVVTAVALEDGGFLLDGLGIKTHGIESISVAMNYIGFVGSDENDRFNAEGWRNSHLKGGAGNDTLEGSGRNVQCLGGTGDDHLTVKTRGRVDGGEGVDTFSLGSFGLRHMITLRNGNGWAINVDSGWQGMDKRLVNIENLEGGGGSDTLRGDAGDNHLSGQGGDDWIAGGAGNDTLLGGSGGDTFLFGRGGGKDTIVSFERGDQVMLLAGLIDPELSPADVLRHYGRWTAAGYLLDFGQTEILLPDLGSIRLLEQALVIL